MGHTYLQGRWSTSHPLVSIDPVSWKPSADLVLIGLAGCKKCGTPCNSSEAGCMGERDGSLLTTDCVN